MNGQALLSTILGLSLALGICLISLPPIASAHQLESPGQVNAQATSIQGRFEKGYIPITAPATLDQPAAGTNTDVTITANPPVNATNSTTDTATIAITSQGHTGQWGTRLGATASQSGSITILVMAAVPSPRAIITASNSISGLGFDFNGDLGNFTLNINTPRKFSDLAPGDYTIIENPSDEWTLTGIHCDNGVDLLTPDPPQVTINLQSSEDVQCTFANFANFYPMCQSFLPIVLKF
ncbi:MAG: hypothetical protein GY869_10055 [Planctomycetes bacterium]|nr:hypothetical protein [Planctomycetota bacterium]